MGTLEIVIGAVLLLISLVTIIICMMQEQKPQNATAALTGASNDSFYDKNRGRTKEARLHKLTTLFRSGSKRNRIVPSKDLQPRLPSLL